MYDGYGGDEEPGDEIGELRAAWRALRRDVAAQRAKVRAAATAALPPSASDRLLEELEVARLFARELAAEEWTRTVAARHRR